MACLSNSVLGPIAIATTVKPALGALDNLLVTGRSDIQRLT
jgi:hypothetical protein